ncbi:MAG: hypothetical protein LUD84_10970 [Clostridiales bacterium]|nr:hypothetical protein [Clostridiales bacterium]
MLQYKQTYICDLDFHMPTSEGPVSGVCYANAAIRLPDSDSDKTVRIKVNIKATNNDSDTPVIEAISISVFELDDKSQPRDSILEEAKTKCISVAMKKTSDLLADATERLCGQRIVLPVSDS